VWCYGCTGGCRGQSVRWKTTAHMGEAAACNACQEGYFLSGQACTKCANTCVTCKTDANTCTSCPEGKYLKDTGCVADSECAGNTYPDPVTRTCKESGIADCTTCTYNATVSKPQCTACGGSKTLVKTEVDGTTTCVDAAGCATDNQPGSHFKTDDDKCRLCSDDKTDASNAPNKGIANCKTCTKNGNGQNPTCSACLDGYFYDGSSSVCTACGANCATCSEANNANKCSTCMAGFFLKGTAGEGQCVPCGDTTQGGIDGCAECSGTAGSLKCTKCKPNRKPKSESGNYTCEEKTCEDETACGGTAGVCGAIVIGASGEMTCYCSQCRQQ
ncbi:Variant-specific surface protein, partial [Giardia duodenalis]